MLTPLVVCTVLLFGTYLTARGGFVAQGRYPTVVGFDVQSASLGLLAILAAAWFFGPIYGFTLIIAVALHEFGHVAAYRICGHHDARFRLVPLLGGVAISDQSPARQDQAFFIALMGPAMSLAPTITAMLGGVALIEDMPQVADFLFAFASTGAMLNFFNLLPFWPLDGGRCAAIILSSGWPRAVRPGLMVMSFGLAAVGVLWHSMLLLGFSILSLTGLAQAENLLRVQRPMQTPRLLLATAAYLATLVAYWLAGGFSLFHFF